MKRRIAFTALALALLLLLGGCAPQAADPLLKNEATDVPGLSMDTPAATADESNAVQVNVTLYFRYLDEPMLAAESHTLTVLQDESVEYAIMKALVDGPSAGHSDLRRLLPAGTQVESVASREGILFVTFNEDFLNDDVPDDWAEDEDWREEAPVLRALTAQSVAASVTESYPYTGVQILVHKAGEVQTSLRLDNAYFLNGTAGLSDPVTRNEALLLTPHNTAAVILTAWQQSDLERLYRYVAGSGKPSYEAFCEALAGAGALQAYSAGSGSVAGDGTEATVTASLSITGGSAVAAYPMQLVLENGVWRITYARLKAMMAI